MELDEVRRELDSVRLRLCAADTPEDRERYGQLLARELLLGMESPHH